MPGKRLTKQGGLTGKLLAVAPEYRFAVYKQLEAKRRAKKPKKDPPFYRVPLKMEKSREEKIMSKITGFGNAEWSVMMGSASFELKGVDAFAVIWPKDLMGPKPAWWPGRVADYLSPNEPVTVEILKALLPGFSEVEWEQRVRGMANTLEIHAVLGDLRIVVTGHAKSIQADAMEEKTKDLREAAIEFQSLIS